MKSVTVYLKTLNVHSAYMAANLTLILIEVAKRGASFFIYNNHLVGK